MGETVRVIEGADWCNVQIAKDCLSKNGIASECWLLGDQVRICEQCVQEFFKQTDREENMWVLEYTRHEGPCVTETVSFHSEEIVFCPRCVRKVLWRYARSCTCDCHESGDCDGNPLFCSRCNGITKLDVIYMTRQQKERHPKD